MQAVRSIQRLATAPLIGSLLILWTFQLFCHIPVVNASEQPEVATSHHSAIADCSSSEGPMDCGTPGCAGAGSHEENATRVCASMMGEHTVVTVASSLNSVADEDDDFEPHDLPWKAFSVELLLPRFPLLEPRLENVGTFVRQTPNTCHFNGVSRHNALCRFSE